MSAVQVSGGPPVVHTLMQQVQLGVMSDAMNDGEWLKCYPPFPTDGLELRVRLDMLIMQ